MESIETLNERLIDHFGRDTSTNQPMFRIVWSDDQLEKRLVEGIGEIQFLQPEVREVPKYSYIKHLYVLERLVVVPFENSLEMLDLKLSYEPLWVYCDDNRNPVPPIWEATKFIIDTLYAALGHKSLAKYVEDEKNTTAEGREVRIKELQDELFGNETKVGDALAYKYGVTIPQNYEKGE